MLARLMGLKTISPGQLWTLVQDKQVTTFDVNSHQSWMQAHVPGALNINSVDHKESDLPADKNSALVFYCSNRLCRKAPNAARRAKRMGYTDVKVMSAGITGWLAAQLPTESGEQAWKAANNGILSAK